MDEKKKKAIYIAIIVVCLAVTAYVMFFRGTSSVTPPPGEGLNNINVNPTPAATAPAATVGDLSAAAYAAPVVFPASNKFDTTILNSAKVKSLNDYAPLTVNPEEKVRDNPFGSY